MAQTHLNAFKLYRIDDCMLLAIKYEIEKYIHLTLSNSSEKSFSHIQFMSILKQHIKDK